MFGNTARFSSCATLEASAGSCFGLRLLYQSEYSVQLQLETFMTLPSLQSSQFSEDATWSSLKQVIASSSGFQRWLAERSLVTGHSQSSNLEQLVSRYLRETLETLAY